MLDISALVKQHASPLPLRIRRYALRAGSGGVGAFPGGDGLVREYEFLTDTSVTVISERRRRPPYGVQGGSSGTMGRNTLIRDGQEQPLRGKIEFQARPGDRLRIETPGGGAYGKLEVRSLKSEKDRSTL